MSNRIFLFRFWPFLFALVMVAPLPGQPPIPRTADGHPDLQGVWTNATLTALERPAALAGKMTVSDAEAAVYEKRQNDELKACDGKSDSDFHRRAGSGETGGYNPRIIGPRSECARVDAEKRTPVIID